MFHVCGDRGRFIVDDGLPWLQWGWGGLCAFGQVPCLTPQFTLQIDHVSINMRNSGTSNKTQLMSTFVFVFKAERAKNITQDADVLFQIFAIGARIIA